MSIFYDSSRGIWLVAAGTKEYAFCGRHSEIPIYGTVRYTVAEQDRSENSMPRYIF